MVFAVLLFVGIAAADEFYEDTSTGVAAGPEAKARPEAILNAQHDMVLSYIEANVPREVIPGLRPLLANPALYIQRYDITREGYSDGLYRVTLNARVNETAIRRDMGALILNQLPAESRVICFVAQANESTVDLTEYCRDQLDEAIGEKRLPTADRTPVGIFHEAPAIIAAVQDDREALCAMTQTQFAQVVIGIWIEHETIPQPEQTNVAVQHVSLRAQFIDVENVKLFRELGEEAKVQSADPATGAIQAIDDILTRTINRITSEALLSLVRAPAPEGYTVDIRGLREEAWWEAVQDRLRVAGPAQPPDAYAYSRASSRLRAYGWPGMAALVSALSDREYDKFRIDIVRGVGRSIIAEAVPK